MTDKKEGKSLQMQLDSFDRQQVLAEASQLCNAKLKKLCKDEFKLTRVIRDTWISHAQRTKMVVPS